MSTLDLAFVGVFIAFALLIGFGGRRLSRVAYSRLLLLLALLMAAFIALYQYFDVGPEPENAALHATAMAFAQLGCMSSPSSCGWRSTMRRCRVTAGCGFTSYRTALLRSPFLPAIG